MDEKTRDIEAQLDQLLEDDRPEAPTVAPTPAAVEPASAGGEQLEAAIDQALDAAQQSVNDLADEIEPLVGAFETIEDVVGTDDVEPGPAEPEESATAPANVVTRELEDSEIGEIERTLEAETEALSRETEATPNPPAPVSAATAEPATARPDPPVSAPPPPPPSPPPEKAPDSPPASIQMDAANADRAEVASVASSSALVQRLARLNGPLLHCAEGTRDLIGLAALTTLAMAGGLLLKAAGVGGVAFLGACLVLVLPVLALLYVRFVRADAEAGEPPAETKPTARA